MKKFFVHNLRKIKWNVDDLKKEKASTSIRNELLPSRSILIRSLPYIRRQITKGLDDACIDYFSVQGRVKDLDSAVQKVLQKGEGYTTRDLTDLIGLRIILYREQDIQKCAQILRDKYFLDDKNSIDKTIPKDITSFGYRSLHLILRAPNEDGELQTVEVQIRTILQHAWAELEHKAIYKTTAPVCPETKRDFARLASVLELLDREIDRILSSPPKT